MVVRDESKRTHRRTAARAGFTLVEILVALVVMGVAMTLIIWFLSASVDLNKENRRVRIATAYAQEQLTGLVSNPSAYTWSLPSDASLGEVKAKHEEASVLSPPSVLPSDKLPARKHEASFYDGFTWKAYSKLSAPDAHHVEVVVVVTWQSTSGAKSGSERSVTLTSSVPRSAVEGKA